MNSLNSREINWRDFHSLLSRGNVDRVVVVNNKYVKVEMKGGGEGGEKLWFTIGELFNNQEAVKKMDFQFSCREVVTYFKKCVLVKEKPRLTINE